MDLSPSLFIEALENGGNLQQFIDERGSLDMYEAMRSDQELTRRCFQIAALRLTKKRIVISMSSILREMFDNDLQQKALSKTDMKGIIREVVSEEYENQKVVFIRNNSKETDVNKDVWRIFWLQGPRMNQINYDFTVIDCPSIRKEVKFFMKHFLQVTDSVISETLNASSRMLNYITKNNRDVKYFADITEGEVRRAALYLETEYVSKYNRNLSLVSVCKSVHSCSRIVEYLTGQFADKEIKSPIPAQNHFKKLKFLNLYAFSKNTLILPENVIAGLELHIDELSDIHKAMYRIFVSTGLRFKEVAYLKADCLQKSRFEGLDMLKYTPYKTLSARRRKILPDENAVLVPAMVSDVINQQIKSSETMRETHSMPYIFITENRGNKASIASDYGFRNALWRIIMKHDIRDEDGELWKISVKQFRKTIAVALIESGASIHEVAYHLGHYRHSTAAKYYADVRKQRLAEMNTSFFREKFEVTLQSGQLENFTEEQRKILYVDFCLEQRRVEAGFCVKPFSAGVCNDRNRLFSSVNCKNLCTGKKYMAYWEELRDSQAVVVQKLLEFYVMNDIAEYESFKEYKQEVFLLDSYENIIEKIKMYEGGINV